MREKEYYQRKLLEIQKEKPFANSTELAYTLILNDILSGTLQPGEKIPQDGLADLFTMSRTPIRDALYKLEQDGFLERSKKAGYQVHKVSFKEFFEFCDYRALCEAHAAYLAANNMTKKELQELETVQETFNTFCDKDMVKEALETDECFHELIVKGSHNRYLYEAFERYRPLKKFFFTLNVETQSNLQRIKNKHGQIFNAIQKNDEEAAEKAMYNHLKNVYNFYT